VFYFCEVIFYFLRPYFIACAAVARMGETRANGIIFLLQRNKK